MIGYDKASQRQKKLAHGHSIRDAMMELGYAEPEIDRILDLRRLVRPGKVNTK